MNEFKIGIIGFGTIGTGVASCLISNGSLIAARTGMRPVLARIADVDITTERAVAVPGEILTTDAMSLIECVDIVVELVGGTRKAKEFVLRALEAGKPVVTANKALLAAHGPELFAAAAKSGVDLYFEASVAGGIPVIKVLKEGLAANRFDCIRGILNGTCNYILTRMDKEDEKFDKILKEAQKLGYAEADPSLDVDGHDTAHKALILASLAFGQWLAPEDIHTEGIRDISLRDIKFASMLGYKLKLLAIIKRVDAGLSVRVHPALIPKESLLAGVDNVFNAIQVSGNPIGDTLYYGRGAGRDATSSAVVADIIDVMRNKASGSPRRVPPFAAMPHPAPLVPMDDAVCRHYLRLSLVDEPGAVAKVTAALAEERVSISSFIQKEKPSPDIPVVIVTHETTGRSMRAAVSRIESLDCVRGKIKLIRIEDV